jgi:protoporphyrinogen IX oxidase
MDVYPWLKACHVAAAMTWTSGLVVAGLAVADRVAGTERETGDTGWIRAVGRWDRCVTFPALLLTWGLGLAMAMQGGWFASSWLMIKLVLVGLLVALHGVLSGRLRRLQPGPHPPPAILRYAAPATIPCVLVIAILVVMKPF